MSLSNTEAFAFTQIPSAIKKKWAKCALQPDTLDRCNETNTHRGSLINSIEIKIDFDDLSEWYQTSCTKSDDTNEDAIKVWREHRELWSEVESAVSETVDDFVKRIREQAKKGKNKSFDAPMLTNTIIVPRTIQRVAPPPPPIQNQRRQPPQSVVSLNTGLSPDDSASHVSFDMSDIQSIIKREMKKQRHEKSEKKKKNGSKSLSLLSYAAGASPSSRRY
jgi:hypothetical protein